MKSRFVQIALVGAVAWLFLTESGRQRRAQMWRLLDPLRHGEQAPYPAGVQRPRDAMVQPDTTTRGVAPAFSPAAATQDAALSVPVSPGPTVHGNGQVTPTAPIETATRQDSATSPSARPAEFDHGQHEPAMTAPSTHQAPSGPAESAAALPATVEEHHPSGEDAAPKMDQGDSTSDVAQATSVEHDEQTESDQRLAVVLENLAEEMETRAIGQEPDVKVEDELQSDMLKEIGIPIDSQETETASSHDGETAQ